LIFLIILILDILIGSSIGELRIISNSKIIFKNDDEEKKQIDEVKFFNENLFCSTKTTGEINVLKIK
jgi:hypothetical protein